MQEVETVAILGCGDAEAAWALLCALARCAVRLHDPSEEALERAATGVRALVDAATGAGALTRGERQRVLDGILFTPDLEEAITGADLVVDGSGGASLLAAHHLRASALVAAPDDRSAARLAERLPHPGRAIALRLVRTPGPLRRAELVPVEGASAHAVARARRLVERVNRAGGR